MVSKFNPLYNGEQAMIQGEAALKQSHRDDFNTILRVFQEGDKAAASSVKPTMDKAIEKAAKVIQEHSMMIRNDQKNSYIDDSYLLLGKARYYKREYLEALETFNYCVQQYPDSKNYEEARYWAARTETALGNYLSAKDKFEKMYRSERLPKKLKGDVFASFGQLEIDQKHYSVAIQLLTQAVDKTRDRDKEIRWMFIIGQLHSALGEDFEASEMFKKVIKKGPPYELLFQAQLNRARNYDVDLQDPEIVMDDLRAMLKDDKNYDNRDQIYYVMAEVQAKLDEDGLEEDYLKESVRKSTINNNQKGMSYLKLAENNFDDKLYTVAAAYYDSSFANIDKENPRFEEVKRKKESLGELVKNLNVIKTQDSLQVLANMGEKQRLRKIEEIVQKEEEAAERAREEEELRNSNPFAQQGSVVASNQGAVQGGQWYFYNQSLRSVGVRDFTNRFGNRKLEDDWRRKDKETNNEFNGGKEADNEGDGGDALASAEEQANGKVQQYLANVPLTEEAMDKSHLMIIDAFINVGAIYKDNFQDYHAAETELKELLRRYPDLEIKGRVWYMLYRINVLANDETDAAYYKGLIKKEFPDSEYARLVDGLESGEDQDASKAKLYYVKTYKKYKDSQYRKALTMADSGAVAFSNTEQGPQFLMIKALSQGKTGKTDGMIETLTVVSNQYASSEQGKEAARILSQIGSGKEEESEKTRADVPMLEKAEEKESPYKVTDNDQHKYILVVPNTRGLVSNMTIAIADFNKKFFKNYTLNTKAVYLNPQEQMIMVSGLTDKKMGLSYVENITQQKVASNGLGGAPVKHFVISNTNFQTFYSTKDFEGYEAYYKEHYSK